jgi:siroheme synthase-like protein
VNVVDDPEYCDFIFPSLISRGNLSVGISTNGASPAAGVLLKRKMEAQIPDNIEEILDFLQEKRPVISQAFKNKKQRFQFYYQISELCMSLNRSLTDQEFKELLKRP